MSGIIKRTVFYEYDQRPGFECYRLSDWNIVQTSLGMMYEPNMLVPYPSGGVQLDWMDAGTKIDEIKNWGSDSATGMLGESDTLIGGNIMPRKGR